MDVSNLGTRALRRARALVRAAGRGIAHSADRLMQRAVATPLMRAAAAGDETGLLRLLAAGAEADERDARGQTALHHAIRAHQSGAAALLVVHGASPSLADAKGHGPLEPAYAPLETLHALRQSLRRHRAASPAPTESPTVERCIRELTARGIARVPGLLDPAGLTRLRADFESFVRNVDARRARGECEYRHYDDEEYWREHDRIYVTNNAFKYSAQLVEVCCDPTLSAITRGFLGRPASISRGVAMRYLPSPSSTADMYGWHHDMEEQRLKMMVLLTDLGPDDQCMSYVVGSHALRHPLAMFAVNTCSLEYCRKHLGELVIENTVGRAGDVFLFDSNGAHRGNRRPGAPVRDALFIEFAVDASVVWGGAVPAGVFPAEGVPPGHPFAALLSTPPKWLVPSQRTVPSWIVDLPRPESWLPSR